MGFDLETVRRRGGKGIERYPISHPSGVDVRRNSGEAVSIDYEAPFPFTGTLEKVDINMQPPQLSSEAQEKTKKLEHDAAIATGRGWPESARSDRQTSCWHVGICCLI
jgi:hypothetical protein